MKWSQSRCCVWKAREEKCRWAHINAFENFHISRDGNFAKFFFRFYLGSLNNVACNVTEFELVKGQKVERNVHNQSFHLSYRGESLKELAKRRCMCLCVWEATAIKGTNGDFMQTVFIVYGRKASKKRAQQRSINLHMIRIAQSSRELGRQHRLLHHPSYHLVLYLASLRLFSFSKILCGWFSALIR